MRFLNLRQNKISRQNSFTRESRVLRTNQKGFTLIEMMVSVSIFAIVLVVSMGAILTIIDSNRKARTLTEVMNNLNFSLESMTRTIKTGVEPVVSGAGNTVITIQAINPDALPNDPFNRIPIQYRLNETTMAIEKNVNNTGWTSVTSDNVEISDLDFVATGDHTDDDIQPKVRVLIEGEARINQKISSAFTIQTTVSQRRLDLSGTENQ